MLSDRELSAVETEMALTSRSTVSFVWPLSWGPTYNNSYYICMLMSSLSIVMCVVFRLHLASLNRHLEEAEGSQIRGKGYRYML